CSRANAKRRRPRPSAAIGTSYARQQAAHEGGANGLLEVLLRPAIHEGVLAARVGVELGDEVLRVLEANRVEVDGDAELEELRAKPFVLGADRPGFLGVREREGG